jgi:hypothetical protein
MATIGRRLTGGRTPLSHQLIDLHICNGVEKLIAYQQVKQSHNLIPS